MTNIDDPGLGLDLSPHHCCPGPLVGMLHACMLFDSNYTYNAYVPN